MGADPSGCCLLRALGDPIEVGSFKKACGWGEVGDAHHGFGILVSWFPNRIEPYNPPYLFLMLVLATFPTFFLA